MARKSLFSAFVLAILLSSGCSSLPLTLPIALPLIVSSAGGGIAYTVTNVAYKTFSHPIEDVEEAVHQALEKMKIEESERETYEDGVRITATTKKLTVYIDLEEITPATTKVRVNAKRGVVLKDKATATEILVQTGLFLRKGGGLEEGRYGGGEHNGGDPLSEGINT